MSIDPNAASDAVKIAVVEIDPKPEWRAGLDRLATELTETGHEIYGEGARGWNQAGK